MKKSYLIIVLIAVLLLPATQFTASAQGIEKRNILINAGLGFGYFYTGTYSRGLPVGIGANMEYSITDEIGVGGYLAYTRGSYNDYYYYQGVGDKYYYSSVDFGVRGSYHFAKLLRVNNKKFDPYAGVLLGFASRNSDYDYYAGAHSVRSGIFAGARYFFSNNFGAYGEAGYGIHPITIGLTFRL